MPAKASYSYKAITATTATIPANILPFITRFWVPRSLSAPLLLDEELELPSLCENPLEELLVEALPLPESVAVDAPVDAEAEELEPLLPESPEWLYVPGLVPLRPGIVYTAKLADAPEEADEDEAPNVLFVPVARKENRTVSSFPSTTVVRTGIAVVGI